MSKIGIGVVGCGFVGRGAHVPGLKTIEQANLVAVADPDDYRRNRAVTKHSIPKGYKDYRELVCDPDIDAVIISVPTPLHTEVALAAIEQGKHVLCEMPLAVNLEETEKMIEAARKKGVVLMPSLTFRFTPNFVKIKQMIQEGAIGKPSAVTYREFIPASDLATQWAPDSWMWNVDVSGGPLFTLAVWSIDLYRWLFDCEITEVYSTVNYTKLDQFGGTLGYDATATVKLANGMSGCLQYSGSVASSAAGSVLEVVGDNTSVLRATDNDKVILLGEDPVKTEWNVKESGPRMWGHEQQDAYFVECLQSGETPSITPEDGLKAMVIAQQIATST